MTREDAITIFKRQKKLCLHENDWFHSLEMAIKALEQQPCEDAISRQAAIDAMYSLCCDGTLKENEWRDNPHIDSIIDALNELPSVSTEETGRWSRKTKVDAYDLCGVKTWGIKCQCDRCTFTTTVVEDFGYYKYCPNCGAKMREAGENEWE